MAVQMRGCKNLYGVQVQLIGGIIGAAYEWNTKQTNPLALLAV